MTAGRSHFSPSTMGSGDQMQVSRLVRQMLSHLLSHLFPTSIFLKNFLELHMTSQTKAQELSDFFFQAFQIDFLPFFLPFPN